MDEFTDALVALSQVFAVVVLGGIAAGAGYLSWRISRDSHAVHESVRWLESERLRRQRDKEPALLPVGPDAVRCRRSLGRASARLLAHLEASGRLHEAIGFARIKEPRKYVVPRRVRARLYATSPHDSPFETVEGLLRFIAAFDVAVAEDQQVPLSEEGLRDMAFAQWAYSGQATPVWFGPGPGEPGAEPRQRWWQRLR